MGLSVLGVILFVLLIGMPIYSIMRRLDDVLDKMKDLDKHESESNNYLKAILKELKSTGELPAKPKTSSVPAEPAVATHVKPVIVVKPEPVIVVQQEPATEPVIQPAPPPIVKPAPVPMVTPEPLPKPEPVPQPVPVLKPQPEPAPAALPQPVLVGPPQPAPGVPQWLVAETQPVTEPTVESPVMMAARRILVRIWNWICVGDEDRAKGVSVEYAVASTWLLRLGILTIILCVGYFLKWSMDRHYLGPAGRVSLSVVTGIALLVWGLKILPGKYRVIGQGFLGGGTVALYFSMYAAGPMYDLVGLTTSFLLMILVTVTASIIAVYSDSLLISIIGVLGGFLTPLLLKTQTPNLLVLYSYMFLLVLGIGFIAWYKQWRLLNYLGLVCNYAVFVISLTTFIKADFALTITFLTLYFIIHSSVTYLRNIIEGQKSSALEVIQLTLNAGIYFTLGYWLIMTVHGHPYPAILSVFMAFFYVGHIWAFMRRHWIDKMLITTLIALSSVFTIWTLPLLFRHESLTIALALAAFMFLWTGYRIRSQFIIQGSAFIYTAVFFRLLSMITFSQFYGLDATSGPAFWPVFFHRLWTMGIALGSLAAASWFLNKKRSTNTAYRISPDNEIATETNLTVMSNAFYWILVLMGFVYVYMEFGKILTPFIQLRHSLLTVLWVALSFFFLAKSGKDSKNRIVFTGMLLCAFIAVGKLLIWHFIWSPSHSLMQHQSGLSMGLMLIRSIHFAAVIGLCFWIGKMIKCRPADMFMSPIFSILSVGLFFLYATSESHYVLLNTLPGFTNGGISVLWALFAIWGVVSGIAKENSLSRYTGLSLFGIVLFKVFFLDMKYTSIIFRVLAFFVIGIVLISGSFAYIRSVKKFEKADDEKQSN